RDGPPTGTRGGRLREPPGGSTGRVGGAGLLPVHGPEPRQDVRVVRRGRRLQVLQGQRRIDVRAAGDGCEGRALDVEVVHVLPRATRVVVRCVVDEVEDLRAGACGSLRRTDRWRRSEERRVGKEAMSWRSM